MMPDKLDPKRCKHLVPTKGLMMHYHQCTREVIRDGYCGIHHPDAEAKRRKASSDKWEAEMAKKRRQWDAIAACHDMTNPKEEVNLLRNKAEMLDRILAAMDGKAAFPNDRLEDLIAEAKRL